MAGPCLPSRESIISILRTLESIIFPGFQTDECLDMCMRTYATQEKLSSAYQKLYKEIKKSFFFQSTTQYNCTDCVNEAKEVTDNFFKALPEIREKLIKDARAALAGDPAAESMEEVILSYPGIEAMAVYRIAHVLHNYKIPLIPRMMSEYAHSKTGIDIHPGAQIGEHFFIDHGTGVVIGETSVIGDYVKIYQGVTLGALSVKKEEANVKRHPTIEDNVTIYAGATILGGDTVIGENSIIGGNVWVIKSIPPRSRIYNKPLDYVVKN